MLACLATLLVGANDPEYELFFLLDDGIYPNNEKLPLILLRQIFGSDPTIDPAGIEKTFDANGWPSAGRNGLYKFHHHHSRAHEALGIDSGWIESQYGGTEGKVVRVQAGDMIIVLAEVSHKNVGQSTNFQCVGAYPKGQSWDMQYGKPGERAGTDERIRNVPLPSGDPVSGKSGLLIDEWQQSRWPSLSIKPKQRQ